MMMTSMSAGGSGGAGGGGEGECTNNVTTMMGDEGDLEKFDAAPASGRGRENNHSHSTARNKNKATETKKNSSTVTDKGKTKKESTKEATGVAAETIENSKPVISWKDGDHEEVSVRDESMEMNSESSTSSDGGSNGDGDGDGDYGYSNLTQHEPLGITTIEFTTSTPIDVDERRKADRDRNENRKEDSSREFMFAPSSVHTDEAEEFTSSGDDVTTDDEDEFLFAGISGGSGVIGANGRVKQRSYHSNTSSLASSWRKEYARKRALNLLTMEDDVEYTQSRLSRRSLVEETATDNGLLMKDDPPKNIDVEVDETNHSSIYSVSFHDDLRDSQHIPMFGGRSDIGRDSSHHELFGGTTLGSSIHGQTKKKTKNGSHKNVDSRHSQGVFSTSSLPREDTTMLQTVLASLSDFSSDDESFALDGPLSKHDKTWEYRMKAAQVVDTSFAATNPVEKEEEIEGSTDVEMRRRTVDVSYVDIEQNAGQETEERKVDIYQASCSDTEDKGINSKDMKDEDNQEDDPDGVRVEQNRSDNGDVEAPALSHEVSKSTRSDVDPPKQKSSIKRDKRTELRRELEAQASAQFADKDKYTKKRLRDSIRRKSSRRVSIHESKDGGQDGESNRSMIIDNLTASQVPMGDDLQKSSKSVPQNSATSRLTEDGNDNDGDTEGKQVKKKSLVENLSDVVFSHRFVYLMIVMISLLFIAVIIILAYFVKGRRE